MKKVIVTGVLLTLISFNVFAGPFRIEMGMSLQKVTNLCKQHSVVTQIWENYLSFENFLSDSR